MVDSYIGTIQKKLINIVYVGNKIGIKYKYKCKPKIEKALSCWKSS